MNKALIPFLVLSLMATGASAIDRGATMVDRISLDVASLDDADSVGASIWGEYCLAAENENLALLAGGGYSEISPDHFSNIEAWMLGIGFKYYLHPLTSLSLVGSYTWWDSEKDVKAGTALLKQRLVSAAENVSPFVTASVTARERSTFSDPGTENSFSETIFTVGGGFDFMLREDMAFAFEASYADADKSPNEEEDLDGWLGSFSMIYYFE